MATNDVPGAVAANCDRLSRGCWAEHTDGSLIYVKDIDENDRVIFEMYDLMDAKDPVYYPHAMAKVDFQNQFSWKPKDSSSVKWTWHDKTAFPWEKVMRIVSNPLPARPAETQISAAQKVASSLKARAQVLDENHVDSLKTDGTVSKDNVKKIWSNLKTVIDQVLGG